MRFEKRLDTPQFAWICGMQVGGVTVSERPVTTASMPEFPDGMTYAAVREIATELWNRLPTERDPAKAQLALLRLITDARMNSVWRELYKPIDDKTPGRYLHPGCTTNLSFAARNRRRAAELRAKGGLLNERDAKSLEREAGIYERLGDAPRDPRWTEQDFAVQLFFWHAYRGYVDLKPLFLSDLKDKAERLIEVAKVLRKQAKTLRSLAKDENAQLLESIASTCHDDARHMLPRDVDDDPGIIIRKSESVELRTFVAALSSITMLLFEDEQHSILAIVADVVFDQAEFDKDGITTREKIREMLRQRTPSAC